MSYQGFVNPDNKLSNQLNRKTKANQPSLRTIGKWREEWVATGNDKKMTFQSFKKIKLKIWHKERYIKNKLRNNK